MGVSSNVPAPGAPGAVASGHVLSEPLVVRLLAVLAAAAGCLDAVCVSRLGGPFASVITGNLVQLGRGVAATNSRLAVSAAAAVAGYALGTAAGSAAAGHTAAGWRRRTSLVALVELALLAGVAAGWLASGGRPGANTALLLLVLAAAAMGVQSALTISTGIPAAATTYLTGTLTTLVRTLTNPPHRRATAARSTIPLAALSGGAVTGGLLLRAAPLWAPALPLVLVGTVVAIAAGSIRSGRKDP